VGDIPQALDERLDEAIDRILAHRDATAALADAELAPLAVLANELRTCPSPAFKARLRAKLERRANRACSTSWRRSSAQSRHSA
jgi:hypothetical protein